MLVTPRRNLVQRALNRVGRRFGIVPFPVAFESGLETAGERGSVFEEIYASNYWGSGESGSGPGSELQRTEQYRRDLLALLKARQFKSMFDAPCGDLNWMSKVLDQWPMDYQGGDISEIAVAAAQEKCPGAKVYRFDICSDPFPDAELWHCRDALFHLSFDDIWTAFENAGKSRIRYAFLTTNRCRVLKNLDVATGGRRLLDLERAPFNLPPAEQYLPDMAPGELPRFVGLWPMTAIAEAVARAKR